MIALTHDGWLLFASCGLRSAAYGWLSVLLGLYLAARGLPAEAIGAIFTAALLGGALLTIALTAVADRLGRRRVLLVGALLMALAGAAFALGADPWLLGLAAVVGTISPSGKDVGPFLSVEQAMLAQGVPDQERTATFAVYNLVGSFAGALGALAVGLPALLGLDALAGWQVLVWAYAATALLLAALFLQLSPAVEAPPAAAGARRGTLGLGRSRGVVARLAALFALDAFAGGFIVQSIVAWWLYLRWALDPAALGAVFFGTNLLAALSFLAAAPLARRIGLLNTMVCTHLPSNVLLILVPLLPTVELSVGALLARHLLSQLDVPTRQSYTMAIVAPEERAAAAGALAVARNLAAALGPAAAAPLLAAPALGLPLLIAGGLKIVYDLAIFAVFRRVYPPEEQARNRPAPATG
jgi:MFS family permease